VGIEKLTVFPFRVSRGGVIFPYLAVREAFRELE